MGMERDFHMVNGEGETSYINNSRIQQKALFEAKPVLVKAVREAYAAIISTKNMVVVDLGCSLGANTLMFVYEVINATSGRPMEVQFFLNDLPGNDFNQIFRSLEQFSKSVAADNKGKKLPPHYIAGLPGSYYTRLFPCRSVHLFHSSFSLHWQFRLPDELDYSNGKAYLNKGNIYIAKTTPPSVVKLYQQQFQQDLLLFLELRYEELVTGGQMVLTFLGRKDEDVYDGSLNYIFGLIAESLQSLVEKGLV